MLKTALKQAVAEAALDYIKPELYQECIIGIGTGSTTRYFIEKLSELHGKFRGCVSSSRESTNQLTRLNIPVFELNNVSSIAFYVDGADESNHNLELIKGGGAALTREKIIAAAAKHFICIADNSKLVNTLGAFPLPIEVIPMAQTLVCRELKNLGGKPVLRQGILTDNGNCILDVHNLTISSPLDLEKQINHIPGVITNGIFAIRPADILLLGHKNDVQVLTA